MTSTWLPDASPFASTGPICGISAVVLARSKPFGASINDMRPASAAMRSGNIAGEVSASSANRRAPATSNESSQPRTRRESFKASVTACTSVVAQSIVSSFSGNAMTSTTHPSQRRELSNTAGKSLLHTLPNGCYTVPCDHIRPAIGQNSQMGRASGRLRYLGLATLFVGLPLLTAGCDPGHPFDDVRVKVFSNGDGSATIAADGVAPRSASIGTVFSDEAFLDAMVDALAIGDPTGPAKVPPDPGSSAPSLQLTGVDPTTLRVSMAAVVRVMDHFGYGSDAFVFVSVCTSALHGRASGIDVEIVHESSCAIWEPTVGTAATTNAVATLRFEERSDPTDSSPVLAVILAILGTAAAATWAASPRRKAWWVAIGIALAAMTTSLGLSIGAVVSGAIHDTWFETGQTFDDGLNTGRRTVVYVAILAGIVLPGVVLLVVPKLRTQRRAV